MLLIGIQKRSYKRCSLFGVPLIIRCSQQIRPNTPREARSNPFARPWAQTANIGCKKFLARPFGVVVRAVCV